MKSTYKLLGSFWDGRENLDVPLAVYSGEKQIRDYKEEYDLFDAKEYIRSVSISELLRLDAGDKVHAVLNRLRFCSKVVIIMDCELKSKNPVIRRFLSKRVSQCLKFAKDNIECETTKIFTAAPASHS